MPRQLDQTDERAATNDNPVVTEGRQPLHDEPATERPDGDERRKVAAQPVLTSDTSWAQPAPVPAPTAAPAPAVATAPTAAAEPVKMKRRLSWGQVLMFLAGVASLVFGVGAVILGGLAGPVTAPVVQVMTYDHTPLLGLIETGIGVVLIVCAFIPGGRWVAGPVAVATIVGGALIVAQLDWIRRNLAAEQRFGWVAIGVGAAAYFGAMVPTKKRVAVSR